jgi:hypothetical protein
MIPPSRGSQMDRANVLLRPCAEDPFEPAATTGIRTPSRTPLRGRGRV